MHKANTLYRIAATTSLILTASACNRPGGADAAPAGETDFSCAALIYAAAELVNDGKVADPDGLIASKHLAAVTAYATPYAKANGLDGYEAFLKVKIEGHRLMGTVSSVGKIPNDQIVERAKKCLAP